MTTDKSGFRGLSTGRDALGETVKPLSQLSSWWLTVSTLPVALTVAAITIAYVASRGTDPGFPPQFATLIYGVASVLVLIGIAVRVPRSVWRAIAVWRVPATREVAAGVLATAGGVLVGWPLTTLLADLGGISGYAVPTLTSWLAIGSVFIGSVVVAPVAEEVLFRGLFLGIVLDRGYGPRIAGTSSLLVFAAVHVFAAGPAGVLNALLLGSLLTWLRLRFDNLAGAWLMHVLNNGLEFAVGLSLLPSLYAV